MTANKIIEGNMFRRSVLILSLVMAAAMIAVSVFVYGALPGKLLLLGAFFVVYVQCPGSLIVRWIGFENCRLSTRMTAGCFSGWALCVLLVYLSSLINTDILLMLCGPAMTLFWILKTFFIKDDRTHERAVKFNIDRIPVSFCIFAVLLLFFCLLNTQYQYLMPPGGDVAFVAGDRAYHMGLVNAISHGFPFISPWVSGKVIEYHIFADVMLSIPVSLFGIDSDLIIQSFAPILTAYCMGLSLYAFFREMSSRPDRAGIYCLIFFMSGMYITRKWTSSIAFKFLFTNANNAGFVIGATLALILLLRKWYEEYRKGNGTHYRYGLLALAFVMLITGIKGPVGAVVIAGIWGTILLGLTMRKLPVKMLLPAVALTAGFLFIYFTVLGAGGQVNQAGGASIEFCAISNIAFWKKALVGLMKAYGIPKILRLPVVFGVFMMFFFTVFLVPFCLGYGRELFLVLSGRKEFDPPRVLVYAMAFVGFAVMMMLHYTGHNEIYFGLVTVAFAPIISFWFIEDMEDRKVKPAAGIVLKGTMVLMSITLVLTSMSMIGFFARKTPEAVKYANQTMPYSMFVSVSRDEYRAMKWIKENTEEDALLASDRYYSVPLEKYTPDNRWQSSFFLYEVYSNRSSYISGSAYSLDTDDSGQIRRRMIEENLKLYDAKNGNRGRDARSLGVDYVVVSKRFTKIPSLSNAEYELCYSNNDVDIYKVSK